MKITYREKTDKEIKKNSSQETKVSEWKNVKKTQVEVKNKSLWNQNTYDIGT